VNVFKVQPPDRVAGDPTAGMVREEAITTEGLWAGFVRTATGSISGWHHHGDHQTSIYVLDGVLRLEFGPGGEDVIEGRPGDFVYIPSGKVHREGNPSDEESHLIVVRAGTGPPTINVDGPEASE
jgi:uncharacterized RmlC-like cupin family protein